MIDVKQYPPTAFLEAGVFNQSVNFEFRCYNHSKHSALLEKITAEVLDSKGNCLSRPFLDSNAIAPSVALIPERKIEPGGTLEIFNPIADFPLEIAFKRLDFTFGFISQDTANAKSHISVQPTVYKQRTILDLPFKGTCLVKDGHDFLSHHRRIPLLNPHVKKIGLTANSDRYGYDFMLCDLRGKVYKEEGSQAEDFFGWGKPVLSPGNGKVVSVANDITDGPVAGDIPPLAPEDLENLRAQAFERLRKSSMNEIAGNHVVIDHGNGEFSFLGHMQEGSVSVDLGDEVERGVIIGKIGNSGDSGTPHIHYNFQSGKDIMSSEGLPNKFKKFSLLLGNATKTVMNLCPNTGMIIKSSR